MDAVFILRDSNFRIFFHFEPITGLIDIDCRMIKDNVAVNAVEQIYYSAHSVLKLFSLIMIRIENVCSQTPAQIIYIHSLEITGDFIFKG